jgi:ring-1,2-phenylacetyl-CoA epoxidase subunit PaaD
VTTTADAAPSVARAWAVLDRVPDPELPAVSVCELGIVRDVIARADGGLEIVLTPTYSGCPATEVIADDVRAAVAAAGLGTPRITLRRAPAWTSDWVTQAGRRKLAAFGIAPPGPADRQAASPLRFVAPSVACPRCGSRATERLSAFGSTACKALHRCLACREPFEHFKPI